MKKLDFNLYDSSKAIGSSMKCNSSMMGGSVDNSSQLGVKHFELNLPHSRAYITNM